MVQPFDVGLAAVWKAVVRTLLRRVMLSGNIDDICKNHAPPLDAIDAITATIVRQAFLARYCGILPLASPWGRQRRSMPCSVKAEFSLEVMMLPY